MEQVAGLGGMGGQFWGLFLWAWGWKEGREPVEVVRKFGVGWLDVMDWGVRGASFLCLRLVAFVDWIWGNESRQYVRCNQGEAGLS